MRGALLGSLVAAALPVAAWAMTEEELATKASEMAISPLPGQYRVRHELLGFEAPGTSRTAMRQMRAVFAEGLAEGNTVCVGLQDGAGQAGLRMLEDLTEGACDFESLEVAGEAIDADMQCRYENNLLSHVAMAARIAPESSEAVMTLEQNIGGVVLVIATVRATTERTGECA